MNDNDHKNTAVRQRKHVKQKKLTHYRLQCWISKRHIDQLQQLSIRLEDNYASLIEQSIDLLYQHEFGSNSNIEESHVMDDPYKKTR